MFFVLFFLHQERELYNEIKEASLKKCLDENIILGPATRTAASKTSEQAISFSFDFAQQLCTKKNMNKRVDTLAELAEVVTDSSPNEKVNIPVLVGRDKAEIPLRQNPGLCEPWWKGCDLPPTKEAAFMNST